jgi:hypothetical protein
MKGGRFYQSQIDESSRHLDAEVRGFYFGRV